LLLIGSAVAQKLHGFGQAAKIKTPWSLIVLAPRNFYLDALSECFITRARLIEITVNNAHRVCQRPLSCSAVKVIRHSVGDFVRAT
jgi:hypothetical protein